MSEGLGQHKTSQNVHRAIPEEQNLDYQHDGYVVRPEFDGMKKRPYATVPLEVVDSFLRLPNEADAAQALLAYVKYVLFGVEDVPNPLLMAWPLLKDKADRTLEGIRNVKKRTDRNPNTTPNVGPSLLNQNHNHNHNQRKPLSGKPDHSSVVHEVIVHLNSKTGRRFRASSKTTTRHINARIAEGFGLDDFKSVIDAKAGQWLNDPKMSRYLRPETLFGTKFEGYLNEGGKADDRYSEYNC